MHVMSSVAVPLSKVSTRKPKSNCKKFCLFTFSIRFRLRKHRSTRSSLYCFSLRIPNFTEGYKNINESKKQYCIRTLNSPSVHRERQGDGDMEREAMRARGLHVPPFSAPEPPNHWRWRMRRGGGRIGLSLPKRVRESTSHRIRNSDIQYQRAETEGNIRGGKPATKNRLPRTIS